MEIVRQSKFPGVQTFEHKYLKDCWMKSRLRREKEIKTTVEKDKKCRKAYVHLVRQYIHP